MDVVQQLHQEMNDSLADIFTAPKNTVEAIV
jgi:hypothetical protein